MHGPPKPAPPEEMVRFLAPLRRAFSAIVAYAERRDRAGLLLGGHLANALHNVPSILWHYDEAAWYKPGDVRRWVERGFLEQLRGLSAPSALVAEAERILSAEGAADALGLPGGPSQVQLPPVDRLGRCLDRLADACTSIRLLRNWGAYERKEGQPRAPWVGLDERAIDREGDEAVFAGELARLTGPLADAVVRWPSFDPLSYVREALARRELIPAGYRKVWSQFVTL